MLNTGKLFGRTIYITGASQAFGKAIALKLARDGANIVIATKIARPHMQLPETVYSAAEEIENYGGRAFPCIVDVTDANQVKCSIEKAVKIFGGIDIVINNATATNLIETERVDMEKYDLMQKVNTRGTFLVSKLCLPYLKKSTKAHILNISPPLNMEYPKCSPHTAYAISKFGMSLCVSGMAEEFKPFNIAVNALWPKFAAKTTALDMLKGIRGAKYTIKLEMMSNAAYAILIQDPKDQKATGNFYLDEDVLKANGVNDLIQYCNYPSHKEKVIDDFFIWGG